MSTDYFQYHQKLLKTLNEQALSSLKASDANSVNIDEEDQALLTSLQILASARQINENFISGGQWAICRIVAAYPQLMPFTPRDLLWLFGGDCLHYMPDEEINLFQQLDERRFAAEECNTKFHYEDERAQIFGLH